MIVAEEKQIVETPPVSDYEQERNKPIPNLIHGLIQTRISSLLDVNYFKDFSAPSELALATEPKSSTPDICIYPKRKPSIKDVEAKEETPPLTTIEIQSPSQSIEELQHKAWNLYFPMGVKSAWIVIPSLKAIKILLHDDREFFFNSGKLHDPITEIEMEIEKIFEVIA